jgi:hypothetical protein
LNFGAEALIVFAPLLRLVGLAMPYLWRGCTGSIGALGRAVLKRLGFRVSEEAKPYSSGSADSGDDAMNPGTGSPYIYDLKIM